MADTLAAVSEKALFCRFRSVPRLIALTSINRSPVMHTNLAVRTESGKYPRKCLIFYAVFMQTVYSINLLSIYTTCKQPGQGAAQAVCREMAQFIVIEYINDIQ
jgi:hypothetical protein